MANILQNVYHPNYVSPPGETLLETLDTLGMTQVELAQRMGRPVETINGIITDQAPITADTALQLEQVLHVPASFWLKLDQHYQESLVRLAEEQRQRDKRGIRFAYHLIGRVFGSGKNHRTCLIRTKVLSINNRYTLRYQTSHPVLLIA